MIGLRVFRLLSRSSRFAGSLQPSGRGHSAGGLDSWPAFACRLASGSCSSPASFCRTRCSRSPSPWLCGPFFGCWMKKKRHPRAWAATLAACLGLGLLLKSLIGVVFPLGAIAVYLLLTRQFFSSTRVEAASAVQRTGDYPAHRRTLAYSSPRCVTRLISAFHEECSPGISRFPVVLLH